MKKFKSLWKMTAFTLAFGMVIIGCNDEFQGPVTKTSDQEVLNLQKYDYVFRVVDVSDEMGTRSANQLTDYALELQELASYFSGIKSANESRNVEKNSILADLAQTAAIAYTAPEVLELVDTLASNGAYVQFSYQEFLVDQCIVSKNSRSTGSPINITSKKALTFNGYSADPLTWDSDYAELRSITVTKNARTLIDSEDQTVSLAIAEDRKEIVREYAQCYADILASSPDAIVTEQSDGSYLVTNNNLNTTIEFDDILLAGNERGIIGDLLKKAVTKVQSAFTNHPVATTIAIGCTVVGILTIAGIITLPAGLSISGNGLTGTIIFFL